VSAEVPRQRYPFELPDLPYAYDALEPHIDAETLTIHHREHHAAYVKKLNEALAKHTDLHQQTLTELLDGLTTLPQDIQTAVKNNGGGHLNHDLFWKTLAPANAPAPRGALAQALARQFGSEESFRAKFTDVASKHFASGWVALAYDHDESRLAIIELKDHEVLESGAQTGLLICDVWEHAYYLRYRSRRPAFIAAYWHVVNWQYAEEAFARATSA
jgi:Fe-Mn family superoxide dismutase